MPRGKKPTDLTGKRFGRLTALQRTATYITGRKPMWFCKCDCGKETLAISQCLVNGTTQSCGCLREEFLTLGPMRAQMPKHRPQAVNVTYPIPENLHPNPLVNEVKRAMYQYRWERVEFEARQIERGTWKEPKKKPRPVFRDDHGKPIVPIDLKTLAEQWRKEHTPVPRGYDAPDVPASYNTEDAQNDHHYNDDGKGTQEGR